MSQPYSITLEGADKLLKGLKNLPDDIKAEIKLELQDAAAELEEKAKISASQQTDKGGLAQGISSFESGELSFDTVSRAPYSAFREFGTRSHVNVPPELAEYAAQFQGNSASQKAEGSIDGIKYHTVAQRAIFEWCLRHGIDKKAWYMVYVKIMNEGSQPKPFFFVHFAEVKKNLVKNVTNKVKNYLDRL